ncbi:hypothetical protein ACFVYF_15060 [Streptomyces sp. NPDC058274]|uniref:hypothetical protein n=1 Tax=Streptomyces sp. NPDC058274 TaxID=3346416 RepID=UPI0036E0C475
MALGIADLAGVALMLSMLACGFVPSLVLGAALGRARFCWALAVCAALGPAIWIFDITVLGDPTVHDDPATGIVFMGLLAFWIVDAPLLMGAMAGRGCPSATRGPAG